MTSVYLFFLVSDSRACSIANQSSVFNTNGAESSKTNGCLHHVQWSFFFQSGMEVPGCTSSGQSEARVENGCWLIWIWIHYFVNHICPVLYNTYWEMSFPSGCLSLLHWHFRDLLLTAMPHGCRRGYKLFSTMLVEGRSVIRYICAKSQHTVKTLI